MATGGASAAAALPSLFIGASSPNYGNSEVGPTENSLSANQYIVDYTVGPYTVPVITNRASRTPLMVRKIALKNDFSRPGQFIATTREAAVYEELIKLPDHIQHILPFKRSKRTNDWIYIDFDYVDGVDFERYLETIEGRNTDGALRKYLLSAAIQHLHWLLSAGYSHGDVKLSNFYIGADEKTYILDFGTSRKIFSSVGINADIVKLFEMARVLFPSISNVKEVEIKEAVRATIPPTASTVDAGLAMYEGIHKKLMEETLVGGARRRTHRRRRRRQTRRA
jgi:serine/threonine protein kinase